MNIRHINPVLILLIVVALLLSGCGTAQPVQEDASSPEGTDNPATASYTGKRIMWVDAYYAEYAWSGQIEEGLRGVLDASGVDFQIVRMDTNRHTEAGYCESAGEAALAEIEAFAPDVLIVTDDSPQKCLVVPHLMDSDLPIVFAGVNWDASVYGYPNEHITGMVEVDLIQQAIDLLKLYANGDRIAYLGPDIATEQKTTAIYNDRFFDGAMQVYLVTTFEEFKETFLQIQTEADMLVIGNDAGIEGWNAEEARDFILRNTRIPSTSRQDWLAPYVLLVMARIGQEQGQWAAQTALSIIDGTPITDIPVTQNQIGNLILNLDMADQLKVVFFPSIFRNADEIIGIEE